MRTAALLAVLVLQACAHQQASHAWEDEQGPDEAGSGGTAGLGTTAPYVFSRMAPGRFTTSQTYPQFFGERVTGVAIAPGSITTTGTVTALSYTATAGSGANGFICQTEGCRLVLGPSNAYLFSSGSAAQTAGDWIAAGEIMGSSYRVTGTTVFDINAHATSGRVITLDCSVNLGGSDYCLAVRDNGTTDLLLVRGDGATLVTSLAATTTISTGTGAATIGGSIANQLVLAGSATTEPITITATGSDTDVDVNVVPKGAGSLEVSSREVAVFGNTSRAATIMCFGEKATSSGTVTLTFTDESCEAFGGTPVCLCGNTSNTTENACSTTGESTTQVTLNGTTSDTYTWACFGARP